MGKRISWGGGSIVALLFATSRTVRAAVMADWTFETSPPASAGPVLADSGVFQSTSVASGSHSAGSTYSSPAGNGSPHSYSSTNWVYQDYYQFASSTTGYSNIEVVFDQTSSSSGPGQFQFQYSTGGTYTNFGSPYTVLENGGSNPVWNSATSSTIYTTTENLSSVTALNNAATVYFRLVENSTVSAGGGTVSSAGTSRVDNVLIENAPTLAVLGLGVSTSVSADYYLLVVPVADFSGVATVSNSGPVAGNYTASSPDSSLSLTGVGTSVPASSSATFNYSLSTLPTTFGTYTGNLTVTPSGTSNDSPLNAAIKFYVGNAPAANYGDYTFGDETFVADIPVSGSLAGLSSEVASTYGVGGAGGVGSVAKILFGSNTDGATQTVGEVWRTRTLAEAAGTVDSDVVRISGVPVNQLYVLQISYDPSNTSAFQAVGQLVLGNWVPAAYENYSGGSDYVGAVPWSSAYETLGDFGYDPATHVAWAVVDHPGTFAVIVPEPASLTFLGLGFATLSRRRSKR